MIRLGHGERFLDLGKDFSKKGRINYMLNRRIEMLKEVTILSNLLGNKISEDFDCETAEKYFNHEVLP